MNTTTTQADPAPAVHTHPEVRRAHQVLQRALDGCADERVREALTRAAAALRTDPTLVLEVDGQRTVDLIAELVRQLKPLGRQAVLARAHARLLAAPDLAEADRQRQIAQLGKVDLSAVDREEEVLERLRARALALAGRARADWRDPEHLRRLALQMLPPEQELEEIAWALRRSVSAAAALAPDAPEVRRLLTLAEQIHP